MTNALQWLNRVIPFNQRVNISKLSIYNSSRRELIISLEREGYAVNNENRYFLDSPLTGTLDLNDFVNLERIEVEGQLINSLILTNCSRLKEIAANDNLLREIILPTNNQELEDVYLANNNFPGQNLLCFSRYFNLGRLFLGTSDTNRNPTGNL